MPAPCIIIELGRVFSSIAVVLSSASARPRTANRYRRFPPETVRRLRFIQRAQAIGFSLAEIAELLEQRVDPEGDCEAVRERLRRGFEKWREKIHDLERCVPRSGVGVKLD
ncbi:MAG: MerR family DNA-binding protein [Gemmatimonadetes bacterium]|nr:MerR family DNA-binding protein [Gemmatimonadota bacterium]